MRHFSLFVLGILTFSQVALWAVSADMTMESGVNHAVAGMKASDKAFRTVIDNTVQAQTPGYQAADVVQVEENGVLQAKVYRRAEKGTPIESGNSLDFFISGDGFFVLKLPTGIGFTRDGRFSLNKDGVLVTRGSAAYPIMGMQGELILQSGPVRVTPLGHLIQDGSEVGVLKIVSLKKDAPLKSLSGTIFYMNQDSMVDYQTNSDYLISSGVYESSNVQLSQEMVKVPNYKNVYDANTKVAKTILNAMMSSLSIGNVQ